MKEFKQGIFETLKELLIGSSAARAVIYTIGHVIIAMTCNNLITGAEWKLAAADAIVEPLINGVWYFMLDKFWTSLANKNKI
jgi:uncharacterized membrane protein